MIVIAVFATMLAWLLIFSSRRANRASSARQRINEQTRLVGRLADLKREYERAQEILPRLKLLLPDTEQLLEVSGEIEALAASHGLEAPSFTFGSEFPPTATEPRAVSINISLNTSLNSFFEYLKLIEALPYTIKFTEIELLKRDRSEIHQINATGKIYIR